ncbi:MAG: carbon storage regulator CsrA [Peptococcaceae bacterium]|nr:carbon storage regulator CsrA [Peptococcaceae bacterium]MDH7524779.1 carbon storage regulator CsrA [Peptococcaceae bacterium]
MLALTRKTGQSLVIGDEIEVTVVEIRGDQVRIAVSAPRNVAVHRKEVYELIREENRRAACLPATLDVDEILGLAGGK